MIVFFISLLVMGLEHCLNLHYYQCIKLAHSYLLQIMSLSERLLHQLGSSK